MFGVQIKLVDDQGRVMPHDGASEGEVVLRGNTIISSYFNDPEASQPAFDEDGWFRTGDIGVIDDNGFLDQLDRSGERGNGASGG